MDVNLRTVCLLAIFLGFSTTLCDGIGFETVINLELPGKYSWELLLDIDNRNNSGKVKRELEVVTTMSTSYRDMVRSLETSTTKSSVGVDLGGSLFDIINIGVKGDLAHEAKTEYERITETKKDFTKTTKKVDTYEVGPHSRFTLYRLVFQGPGISYVTDTLSSTPHPMNLVKIDFKVRQIHVLKDIHVVYTSDSISRPAHHITEARGQNPDINSGFRGQYVWLVPIWTPRISEGATGIQIAIQKNPNPKYRDLAKGAGGDYRYIKMLKDPYSKQRITSVSLYRSGHSNDNPRGKWERDSGDINSGRKGDFLWIVWNERTVQPK